MSCNLNNFIDCPALQETLNGQFGRLSPSFREMNPFTGFLISPVNTNNTLQTQIDRGDGHIRTVEVRYSPRLTEDQVSHASVQNCDGGQEPGETSHSYEIDTEVGSSRAWTITPSKLIRRCEEDPAWFARHTQAVIDVIVRDIETQNLQKAALLKGDFVTSGNSTSIHVATKNTSNVYIPDAMEDIPFEFKRMNYTGPIALFSGSKKFENYFKSQGAACCNTTLGMDLPSMFRLSNLNPFFDYKVETEIGPDEILAMAPGALQFLTYLEFKGMQVFNDQTYKQGTIFDPFSGLMFDYLAKFDCGVWNFQIKLAHDLVAMPQDMFCADDIMNGVTWVNGFKIVNS